MNILCNYFGKIGKIRQAWQSVSTKWQWVCLDGIGGEFLGISYFGDRFFYEILEKIECFEKF